MPETSTLPATRQRLARLPGPRAIRTFAQQLRRPLRNSTVRGMFDGVFVAYTLRKRGLRTLMRGRNRPSHVDVERSTQVAAAVDAGLCMLPMAQTCLRRSVTLVRELRRLELSATLHIGVRYVADRMEAHAWVQVGDTVINDDPVVTATYAELATGHVERILPLLQ